MKKLTFITGHYGSGKSEFTLNLAVNKGIKTIVDLDIVNPYFRSRELEDLFKEKDIRIISSTIANSLGSDLPYIKGEAYLLVHGKDKVIYDLGGDPVGAKILRQFVDIVDLSEVDLLLCVNVYREETSTVDKIIKMIEKIESSGGLRITGLINNSNFIKDTVITDIVEAQDIIVEVGKLRNLEIVYTGVYEKILNPNTKLKGEVIPLKLYLRKKWL
jgi:hypothetical protein